MIGMKQLFKIVLICFLSVFSNAQDITPKFTLNVELGLPVSVANEPFGDIMQGLVASSVYGQYSFPFHLNLGLGVRYSLFTIDEFSVPSPVDGNIQTGAGFLKIGWDKFHNDKLATDFGVKVGYAYNAVYTDLLKLSGENPRDFDSFLVEPTMALILAANERNSYRWTIGYSFQGYGFQPATIGLPSTEGYDPAEFKKMTQYLVVGFGWTLYFNGKKE